MDSHVADADEQLDPWQNGPRVPHDALGRLRQTCPVAKGPQGAYYLARFADVEGCFANWRTFANAGGMRLPGVTVPDEELLINERDGRDHQRIRRLMQEALRPNKVRELEPYITDLAGQYVAAAQAKGVSNLVADLTDPIPARVIAHVMGLPEKDHAQIKAWTDEVVASEWPTTNRNERGVGFTNAFPEFASYLDDHVAQRRAADPPPDDFITRLLREVRVNGELLSDTELRMTLAHLLWAGNETTTNLLGNVLYELIGTAGRYAEVRADRRLVPVAIEESLRMGNPTTMLTRTCTKDVEVAGQPLVAGERVVLGIASAHRDPAMYDEPDEFRLDRAEPSDHLAFGKGPHHCLGSELARLETRVTVDAFLDQVDSVRLADGFQYEKISAFWVSGPVRLDVVFDSTGELSAS